MYERGMCMDKQFEDAHSVMLNRVRLHKEVHPLHVFCASRCLLNEKRIPYDINFAVRLCELLGPEQLGLMPGTWINMTQSASGDGRAIAGVMTGGSKLPLGATV